MAGFKSVLESLGYAAGALTGGPSQTKAIAGAAAASGKINTFLRTAGEKVGGVLGADVFDRLSEGASITADKEEKAFVDKQILQPAGTKIGLIAIALLCVVGFFFYRRHHA